MTAQDYEIGMVGLGVMGRNLVLNMADHGFAVAGYDRDAAKIEALRQEARQREVRGAADIKEFIALLRRPRGHDAGARRRSGGFGHQGFVAASGQGRSHH